MLATVLLILVSSLFYLNDSTSYTYPNSCINLEDGYYDLKLMDGDDYPVVNQKCSNGYTILDYNHDNNIKDYFISWHKWHIETYGPTNNDIVNWQGFYLPDSNENSHSYLVSPDCSTCDADGEYQVYQESSTYWMTGTIFGCFWVNKGNHNCDLDLESGVCYYCTSQFVTSDKVIKMPEDATAEKYSMTGICPTTIQASDYDNLPVSHYDCARTKHVKPSIGGNGRFCVCAKPDKNKYYKTTQVAETQETETEDDSNDEIVNIKLYSSDFKYGTYRITKPGVYTLMEDVYFDFNSGDIDDPQADGSWWPNEDQSDDYPGAGGYRDPFFMGFWAGFTIETDNVILDLGGYTIAQSLNFYYQQRWFVGVELNNQYFLPGQGLGQFGASPLAASNTIIKNGVIGLSSHHGIHGNNNENIILKNLVIKDFETHGIQLNGFNNVELDNIEIGPTSTKCYFKGEYAHMRALLPRLRIIAEETEGETISFYNRDSDSAQTMQEIVDEIEMKMNMVWNHVVKGTEYDSDNEDWIDAKRLFYSESGLPYAGAHYGLFLNTFGASVFTYNLYTREISNTARVNNVKIYGLRHEMDEYLATRQAYDPGLYINPFTAPFDGDQLFDDYSDPVYKGSIITDAYMALEYFSENWDLMGAMVLGKDNLLKWAMEGDKEAYGLNQLGGVQVSCNFDVMLHSGKGINGLRLDGVDDIHISNIEIYDIVDTTPLGREDCGEYGATVTESLMSGLPFGHFRQTGPMQDGFSGNIVQGMQINAATNLVIKNAKIHDLESTTGKAIGIAVWPANSVELKGKIEVYNVIAGSELENDGSLTYESRPNSSPEACGIMIYSYHYSEEFGAYYSTVTASDTSNIKSWNIEGHVGCIGDDTNPTMIGYGSTLNEMGVLNDENTNNYDDLSTILLDNANSISDKNNNNKLSHMVNNKLSFKDEKGLLLVLIPFITISILLFYLFSNRFNKKDNEKNIEYTSLETTYGSTSIY